MWCSERIDDPMLIIFVGNQSTDADNGVVNVLREFVAEFCSDFIVGFSVVTLGGSISFRSGTVSISQASTLGMLGARRILQQHRKIFHAPDTLIAI
jgi:hypothetical protein